ncbi:MAG: hypothetical protein WEG36_08560 [Gemmatimonadota bacterium]
MEPSEVRFPWVKEANLSDSVAVDAKRILLRYGVPIRILDDIKEKDRIAFARVISKTPVPDRGERLLELLVEHKFLDAATAEEAAKRYRKAKKRSKK